MKLNDKTWVNSKYVERVEIVPDPVIREMRYMAAMLGATDLDDIPDSVRIVFTSGEDVIERDLSVEQVLDILGWDK